MNDAVESELSPAFCNLLWQFLRGSLAVLTLALAYVVLFLGNRTRSFEWRHAARKHFAAGGAHRVVAGQSGCTARRLRPAHPVAAHQGHGGGDVLLIGCVMVFRKRAGIVLLHGGIALMMISELLTGNPGQGIADDDSRGRHRQPFRRHPH